ncbi:MAG TPA: hypothetical protein VN207_01980 [Ktedonobacteraceae bacterium]|nr:hypothetical protein [Ktedonobacteraceae bacterium]
MFVQLTSVFGPGGPELQTIRPFWDPQFTVPFGGNVTPTKVFRTGIKPAPLHCTWLFWNVQLIGPLDVDVVIVLDGSVIEQTSWPFWGTQLTFNGDCGFGFGFGFGLGFGGVPLLTTQVVIDISTHGVAIGGDA